MDEVKKRTREYRDKDRGMESEQKKHEVRQKIDNQFTDTRKFYAAGSFLGEKSQCDRIIGKFNNFIKSIIIKRCLRIGDKLFDIGGGQGQDLEKYNNSGIGELVLVDQSDDAIKEATKRYREGVQKKRYRFNGYFLPVVNAFDFGIMDKIMKSYAYFTSPAEEKNWIGYFDIVSSQLAFHYSFINEHSIRQALKIVSSSLKSGGLFIGTIPNGEFVMKNLINVDQNEYSSKSNMFKLKLTDHTKDSERCQMTICGKSGPMFEPVVTREIFDKYASEFGLEPYSPNLHFRDFSEIFNYYIQDDDNERLSKRFFSDIYDSGQNNIIHDVIKEQWNFYCAFAYRKK